MSQPHVIPSGVEGCPLAWDLQSPVEPMKLGFYPQIQKVPPSDYDRPRVHTPGRINERALPFYIKHSIFIAFICKGKAFTLLRTEVGTSVRS